jgi:hypothetical protein
VTSLGSSRHRRNLGGGDAKRQIPLKYFFIPKNSFMKNDLKGGKKNRNIFKRDCLAEKNENPAFT